jgi:hydrogenase expression/formation protein HypE
LDDVVIDARAVRPGDRVLVSGPIGDHGVALLAARGEPGLGADVRSDTRSIAPLVESLVAAVGSGIRWMRCPTRGVAATLADLARESGRGVELAEAAWPVRNAVREACRCIGLDALHFATEGQFLAVVAPDVADVAIATLQATPGGEDAAVIGEIVDVPSAAVVGVALDGASHVIDIARAAGTGTEVRHV